MIRFFIVILLCLIPLSAETTIAQLQQELRVALVIANGDYDEAPLKHAVENGRKMRDFLKKHRFNVLYAENANKRDAIKLIREFSQTMKPNCLALFYYNGHAVQLDGENFIVPIENSIVTDKHIGYQAIPVDTLSALMRKALNRLNIVIIDGAYPKPFGSTYAPPKPGLAAFKEEKQLHFILAKQPDSVSSSNDFADRFIKTFAEEAIDLQSGIQQMIDTSKGDERPWIVKEKKERFFFIIPQSLSLEETAVWKKTHASNTPQAYEAFISEYPKSSYLKEAKAALQKLQDEKRILQEKSAAHMTQNNDLSAKMSPEKITPGTSETLALAPMEKSKTSVKTTPKPDAYLQQQKEQIASYKAMLAKRGIEIIEPKMATVPAGSFMMGSEKKVTFNKTFKISECEVTYHEYSQYLKAINKYPIEPEQWRHDRQPVINVTWQQAYNYAQWLKRYTGKAYRLPTEAEWEYAARAGTTTLYHWGEEAKSAELYAWMAQNAQGITHECGSLPANALGLYDMAGNVWEWVADENEEGNKILKGGSWSDSVVSLAPHYRRFEPINYSSNTVGFRLLLEEI